MNTYYDMISEYKRGPFLVIVDKCPEQDSLSSHFDECEDLDIYQLAQQIDNCELEWFCLRVRAMIDGVELAEEFRGGLLYKDAQEVLTDGVVQELEELVLEQAKHRVCELATLFTQITKEL